MDAKGIRYIEYPSRKSEIKIWDICDAHLGNKAAAKDKLMADIKNIRTDPESFWLSTGDYGDFISAKDRRFDSGFIDPDIFALCDIQNYGEVLTDYVRDIFKPITHKCLGFGFGNHEWKYLREQEQTGRHGWLCREFGTLNLGYSSFFKIGFLRKLFRAGSEAGPTGDGDLPGAEPPGIRD